MTDDDTIEWMRERYPSLFAPDGTPLWQKVTKQSERDVDHTRGERAAEELQEFCAFEVKKLIEAVDQETRITAAAPFRPVRRYRRSHEFDARHPQFIARRHQVWLDHAGQRSFTSLASELDMTAQAASHRRAELSLLHLVQRRAPPWSALNAKIAKPPDDEAPIVVATFAPLWEQHEADLVQAEQRKLFREGAEFPLLSTRGKMLIEFWKASTTLKRNGGYEPRDYRRVFDVLGHIVEFVRASVGTDERRRMTLRSLSDR